MVRFPKYWLRNMLPVLVGMMLVSCSGGVKDNLGLRKRTPDEFKVIATPPLTIPPDFSLRPPLKTGTQTAKDSGAKSTILGQEEDTVTRVKQSSPRTAGEEKFLDKAAVKTADPTIREVLAYDNMPPEAKKKTSFFKKMLPSYIKAEGPDAVVDAAAEKKRLDDNKKHGKPVTEGETPTIAKKPSALDKLLGKNTNE